MRCGVLAFEPYNGESRRSGCGRSVIQGIIPKVLYEYPTQRSSKDCTLRLVDARWQGKAELNVLKGKCHCASNVRREILEIWLKKTGSQDRKDVHA